MDPVSIRTNNPGAMWFGPVAKQFGSTGTQNLADGNNAAVFDDPVNGAAAHFALLHKNYRGMPLSGAISKWSGGNSSGGYTNFITKQTGLSPDTVITPDLLASPQGIALAKAQAHWEAGRPYPMTDAQWEAAQRKGLGGVVAAAPASEQPNVLPGMPQGLMGGAPPPSGVLETPGTPTLIPPGAGSVAVANAVGTPAIGKAPADMTDDAMKRAALTQKAIDQVKEAEGEKQGKQMMALAQQLMAAGQAPKANFMQLTPINTGPVRPLPLNLPPGFGSA